MVPGGMDCESCENHAAAYEVVFTDRRGQSETFNVCWICMAQARRGPRPPAVAVLPTGGDAA